MNQLFPGLAMNEKLSYRRFITMAFAASAFLVFAACGSDNDEADEPASARIANRASDNVAGGGGSIGVSVMKVTSASFKDGGEMPQRSLAHDLPEFDLDCGGGSNAFPQLSWTGAPAGAGAYAVIMMNDNTINIFDDAGNLAMDSGKPAVPGRSLFWVLLNIPKYVTGLPEGSTGIGVEGKLGRDLGTGYTGPCLADAVGENIYRIKVYALKKEIPNAASYVASNFFTGEAFEKSNGLAGLISGVDNNILGSAEITAKVSAP